MTNKIESVKMPHKPFKIFVINGNNNQTALHNIAVSVLRQSMLADQAEILGVTLESNLDWMPPGYIHVQGFGSLQVMCSHEGHLTEDLIQTMSQICREIPRVFKNNLRLSVHLFFNRDKNDEELNKDFLLLQHAVGQIHYVKIKSDLAQTLVDYYNNAAEFKEKSDALAYKIYIAYTSYVDKILEAGKSSESNIDETISSIMENFNHRINKLNKKVEDYTIKALAKKESLEIQAAHQRLFARRTAEGYHLAQEAETQEIASPSVTQTSSRTYGALNK